MEKELKKPRHYPHPKIALNVCEKMDSVTCLGASKLTLKGTLAESGKCLVEKTVETQSPDCGHTLMNQVIDDKLSRKPVIGKKREKEN